MVAFSSKVRQIKFKYRTIFFYFNNQSRNIMNYTMGCPFFLPVSIRGHWFRYATSKASFADSAYDLHLCNLQHPDHLGEGRTHIRVRVPAASHYLAKGQRAIMWYGRPNTLIYNSKCSLHGWHVLEGKHAGYKLPQYDAKAININFLIVGSMLDHLPAYKTLLQLSIKMEISNVKEK